jgi:hypothetical protein
MSVLGPVFAVVAALRLSAEAATRCPEMIGEDLLASIVRGGKLYDNWFGETRVEADVLRTSPIRRPPCPTAAGRNLALLRMPRLGLAGCRRGLFQG